MTQAASSIILNPQEYGDKGLESIWVQWAHRVEMQPMNLLFLLLFILALLHLFAANYFGKLARLRRAKEPPRLGPQGALITPSTTLVGRLSHNYSFFGEVLYFLAEVEVILGLWCVPILAAITSRWSWQEALRVVNNEDYRDALFIMVVMCVAATRPLVSLFDRCIGQTARLLGGKASDYWLCIMTLGPLLSSLIKETVAMTVACALLSRQFFAFKPSPLLAYLTMGLLFVNVSIGGMLTNFATSAVTLLAERWHWSTSYMLSTFGWRAVLSIFISNMLVRFVLRSHFNKLDETRIAMRPTVQRPPIPSWVTAAHLLFLIWLIFNHANTVIALGSFVLFLGFYQATAPYQLALELKEPIFVGFLIASLILHSDLQSWWISPIVEHLDALDTMGVMTLLSSIQPNAALTLISSKIPYLNESLQYYLVAGIMAGGGLTLVGNGPNFIAYGLLSEHFNYEMSLVKVFLAALLPTAITFLFFMI